MYSAYFVSLSRQIDTIYLPGSSQLFSLAGAAAYCELEMGQDWVANLTSRLGGSSKSLPACEVSPGPEYRGVVWSNHAGFISQLE